MNITIILGAFFPVPPIRGGAVEKMWFQLGKEFAVRGHKVTTVSRLVDRLPPREEISGVVHRRIPGRDQPRSLVKLKWLDLLYTWAACRLVPADSDVVVTNTFWAPICLPTSLARKAFVDVQRMPKGQCRLYWKAARLRANSTPVLDAIQQEVHTSRRDRVCMIPNPLPFDPLTSENVASKDANILYCGRINPEKGLDILARASHQMPKDWRVEVVGPWETQGGGGGRTYVEELRRLADCSRFHIRGPIYDVEELSRTYSKASVFVYPSVAEHGETFGLAPLEAMAHGAVPVVSDLACFKDFVRDGENGLIFNHRTANADRVLADIILRLASDPNLREQLSRQALKVNATHAPGQIATQFLEEFGRITADENGS